MQVIKNIKSNISTKLLLVLLSITTLSFAVTILAITTLNKTRDSQIKLSQQTLPILKTSQNFSQSILEYMIILERLSTLTNIHDIKGEKNLINKHKNAVEYQLSEMAYLTNEHTEIKKIKELLTKIYKISDHLQEHILNEKPFLMSNLHKNKKLIQDKVTNINLLIKRHLLISSIKSNEENQLSDIQKQLSLLSGIINRYTVEMSEKEIQRLKIEYIDSVRKITNLNLLILDKSLKITIAENTNFFLKQGTSIDGFFKQTINYKKNNLNIEKAILENRAHEKTLNSHLSKLLAKISDEATAELSKFDTIINQNILILICIFIATVFASIDFIFLYVIPKITKRLNRLADDTNQIASGNFKISINTQGEDEISQMSIALEKFKNELILKEKIEKKIQESETKLRNVIKNALDGLITVNDHGLIESFNPACEKIFGYSYSEAIGEKIDLLLYKSTNQSPFSKIKKIQNTHSPHEVKGKRKDGTLFPMEISLSEVQIGHTVLYTGIIRDITKRKKIENELKETNSLLSLMMENNPDLIYVKDQNFNIIQANQAFLNIFPKIIKENIIRKRFDKFDLEDEDIDKTDQIALKKGYSEITETIQYPDDQEKLLFTRKISFQNSKGDPLILCVSRDITEREKLIDELTDSNEELERFAYVASHDLQEPLRMITSFSEKLDYHLHDHLENDQRGKKYFKFITESAVRAQNLISDILSYSSIDRETKNHEYIDLNQIINNIHRNISTYTEEKDYILNNKGLPSVVGNKAQIYQLLQNLIENGLKYQADKNTPEVTLSYKDLGVYWQITVADNGIGIDPVYFEKIFYLFHRLHTKNEYSGTGIGLCICKRIVERHGGKIWVESTEGKGSAFYFTLLKKNSTSIKQKKAL